MNDLVLPRQESDMTREGSLHFREFLLSIALGSVLQVPICFSAFKLTVEWIPLQLFPALKAYEGIELNHKAT